MKVRGLFEALAKDLGVEIPQTCLELDKYLPALKPHEKREVQTCITLLEAMVRDILVRVVLSRARSIADVVRAAEVFGRKVAKPQIEAETIGMWTYDHIATIIGAIRYVLFDLIGKEAIEKAFKLTKT